jgi:hypothetical protein
MIFVETDDGFIIQGTAIQGSTGSGESMGQALRETLTLKDDDVGGFMDEAIARRGQAPEPTPKHYESQLRVLGRFFDQKHPRDLFFFELDGAYIARISVSGQGGLKHELLEFTRDDVADLIAQAPALRRGKDGPAGPG